MDFPARRYPRGDVRPLDQGYSLIGYEQANDFKWVRRHRG
jgi:hypothetical protein